MKLNNRMVEMMTEVHMMTGFMPLLWHFVHSPAEYTPRFLAVELGVSVGHSTIALLSGLEAAVATLDLEGRLISCDIEVCETAERNVALAKLDRFWTFEVCDSVEFAKTFGDGKVHLLFVDTSHEADHTTRELEVWAPKIAPEGRILLHDTMSRPDGVGVPVAAFAKANPTWSYYNIDIDCGLGVLQKPS